MSELKADKLVDGTLAWRAPPPLARRIATTISNAWYELRKSRTASIGAVMLVLLFGACIATPWIATHDPIKQNYRERLQPPSEKHLLGTDRMGRDIYSRLLYGGRRLVTIAVVAVALSLVVGVPFGVLTGYFGGLADTIGMRIVDGLLAFPGLLLYLLFVTVAQAWKFEGVMLDVVLVGALALAGMPEKARLARGSVLAEKQKEYVEASRAVGDSSARIALSQILPNILSPLIVTATVRLGFVILIVAALSFLGLGTPPPTPGLGVRPQRRSRLYGNPSADRGLPGPRHLLHGAGLQPVRRRPARHPRPAAGGALSMAETVLALDELTVRFRLRRGDLTAVDGVSFSIERGQTFGLVGEVGLGQVGNGQGDHALDPRPAGRDPARPCAVRGQQHPGQERR